MTGIRAGKDLSQEDWTYIKGGRQLFASKAIKTPGGQILVREPAGFPYKIALDGSWLSRAARLRLMKAVSLSIEKAIVDCRKRRSVDVDWIRIKFNGGRGETKEEISFRGERDGKKINVLVDVPARWFKNNNISAEDLRACIFPEARKFISTCSGSKLPAAKKIKKRKRESRSRAKVLFYRNYFLKDVDRGEAYQINPGIHYLITSLIKKGVSLVLLDGKIPLQDVCERPPHINDELSPEQFISSPAELENALLGNPDLSLVCLTVLERCFGQIRSLCRFIRERSNAFIAIGGVFPTKTPEHAFVHIPDVNFIVRGDGEEVLPEIVSGVAGRTVVDGIDAEAMQALGKLSGVLVDCENTTVACRLNEVNRVADLDKSGLDFSFFEKKNVESGISISTSRGCIYNCRFCSVMDKRIWRGKSAKSVLKHLGDYKRRLVQIYGSEKKIPQRALSLQIWDDDFFIDPKRARDLLPEIAKAGFKASFLQGTVNSFFKREGKRITGRLNEPLLDSIACGILTGYGGIKIGTENFVDEELRRLGKPYTYDRIRKLALSLGKRNIDQEHYLIICNRHTTLENLMENFEKITELRWVIGETFKVLEPSWLIELFPTPLYKTSQFKGTADRLPDVGRAEVKGYGEFDYPFVIPEKPQCSEVFEIARRFPKGMHFGAAGDVKDKFDDLYEPRDADYLLIFEYIQKLLRARRKELLDRVDLPSKSELYRIERCLVSYFAKDHKVPSGLLGRLAPALHKSLNFNEGPGGLYQYVKALFREAKRQGDINFDVSFKMTPEAVEFSVTDGADSVLFMVQRLVGDTPCAFASKNLAFIFRSPGGKTGSRPEIVRIIEKVRRVAEEYDTFFLD